MNELTPEKLRKPMDRMNLGNDVAALNGLISMLNDPALTGADVPKGVNPMGAARAGFKESVATVDAEVPPAGAPATEVVPPVSITVNPRRLFFTGRLFAGKDYCAAQAEATIFGIADPLYYLATHFFKVPVTATENKDLPGMRAFLQAVGQWGRGTSNEQYPFTPARATFVTMIRSLYAAGVLHGSAVDWDNFGHNENIWIDACLKRAEPCTGRAAITSVRFADEFNRVRAEGWRHWHVMTSQATWRTRLAARKLTPDSVAVKDTSERLAMSLDADVIKKISAQPRGNKMRVIWNDPAVAPPSNRLYTINEFLQEAAIDEVPLANTGE